MILKHNKRCARNARAKRTRKRIESLSIHRLNIHRTPRHIYAQIISLNGNTTLVSASTVEALIRHKMENGGNCNAATVVGRIIAERACSAGIEHVAFDRSGFKYHGRIKALAEAARESGLRF